MLKRIKDYFSQDLPDEDILEAIEIAKKEDCIVRIKYIVFNFAYKVYVLPTSTLEEIKEKLPKTYGL